MKKIISFLLIVFELTSIASLSSCSAGIRKANIDDIEVDLDYGISDIILKGEGSLVIQSKLQIKDLVIEIDFLSDSGLLLETVRVEVGTAEGGSKYRFRFYISDDIINATSYSIRVVEGYVINLPGQRKVEFEDVSVDLKRDWSSDKTSLIYTVYLQANEYISDLVIEFTLKTEDGTVIKTFTINSGFVEPGIQYSYQLDVSDIQLGVLINDVDMYDYKVLDGYVYK